ncbi:glycosyltransferase [Naasia sp. SYSU D00057]|uniref:glycosyltransferase n=1 Tax=Naasia sp. SYSU D00057 TaxID=2817380 RepID=UPI001B315650|nr:hypothetical protein [Naasia sp. SYSU D00057]
MRVLQTFSFDDPRDLNPFGRLLVASLPAEVLALPFDWRRAVAGRYEVLHVHWPEYLYRAPRPWAQPIKTVLCALLLLRLALTPVALVRTVHNVAPHEAGSRLERAFLRALERRTDISILMNTATAPIGRASVLIPHGHYRDSVDDWTPVAPTEGHVVLFGLLRPYKGIEELIAAFRSLPEAATYSLTVAGEVSTRGYGDVIQRLAGDDDRIALVLKRVDESALLDLVRSAQLVVLPYRTMLNSGAALLALSLNTPILIRDTPVGRELLDEFGPDAVHTFSGNLTSASLKEALDHSRALDRRHFAVDMGRRDWSAIGAATAEAYRRGIFERASRVGRRHAVS